MNSTSSTSSAAQDFDPKDGNSSSNLLHCKGAKMRSLTQHFRVAYVCGGCISCVFLTLTLYVYLTLPSLRNLHGKIVVFNVVSILLTTLLLVFLFNVRPAIPNTPATPFIVDLSAPLCKTLGYLTYYSGKKYFFHVLLFCITEKDRFIEANKFAELLRIYVTQCKIKSTPNVYA